MGILSALLEVATLPVKVVVGVVANTMDAVEDIIEELED